SFFSTHSTAPEIYTLSLHDALPILLPGACKAHYLATPAGWRLTTRPGDVDRLWATRSEAYTPAMMATIEPSMYSEANLNTPKFRDRKSTRLNFSHVKISYAVFCLKK